MTKNGRAAVTKKWLTAIGSFQTRVSDKLTWDALVSIGELNMENSCQILDELSYLRLLRRCAALDDNGGLPSSYNRLNFANLTPFQKAKIDRVFNGKAVKTTNFRNIIQYWNVEALGPDQKAEILGLSSPNSTRQCKPFALAV